MGLQAGSFALMIAGCLGRWNKGLDSFFGIPLGSQLSGQFAVEVNTGLGAMLQGDLE